MVTIQDESRGDEPAIRQLHLLAFARDAEASLVDALRESGDVVVSLVARTGGNVAGHVLFSALTIDGESGAVSLAPIGVRPQLQRRGLGSELIRRGIDRCKERGCSAIIVLGDPAYYGRFGFSSALAQRLVAPYAGPHFMGLELRRGALESGGIVRYPIPFEALDAR